MNAQIAAEGALIASSKHLRFLGGNVKTTILILTCIIWFGAVFSVAAQNAQSVFTRTARSVVVVQTPNKQGSGVVVESFTEGFSKAIRIATNCHVVENSTTISVIQMGVVAPATIDTCDRGNDLAILSLKGDIPVVAIRSTSSIVIGEPAYAIGAPKGMELSISDGIVSQIRKTDMASLIQTSAPISPGSSGGGLFDSSGRLLGITTHTLREAQNLNFAVSSDLLVNALVNSRLDPGGYSKTLGSGGLGSDEAPIPKKAKRLLPGQIIASSKDCGWKLHDERASDGVTVYADLCSKRLYQGFVAIWVLRDYSDAKVFGGALHRSRKDRLAFDCISERSAVLVSSFYDGNMGEGAQIKMLQFENSSLQFTSVIIGSLGQRLMRSACG